MISYQQLKKIFFKLDPETAHAFVEFWLRFADKITPFVLSNIAKNYFVTNEKLEQKIFNVKFPNPIGIAAGFDKNATMLKGLSAFGFGYIEYGTVTPKPQKGNDKPRLFRFPQEEILQNAMGFNNQGQEKIAKRINKYYPYATPLGVNIGKNKLTSQEDALSDYISLVNNFSNLCDYFAINISSPNTPNLRDLQNTAFIKDLFQECTKLTNKPILLKISPDISVKDAISLCACAVENGAQGIIATNTTTDYSLFKNAKKIGGLSGKILKEKSFTLFNEIAKEFYSKTILISVGGIDSPEDVYNRLKAGASLVQLYSSFIFKGPMVNYDINQNLLKLMQRDSINHISELIGSDRRKS